MENALYVALSQQMALRRMLDVTANNVANMNTTAYRAERPVFDDFVSRVGKGDQTAFVVDRATYTDLREGTITTTGNPLDIAIRGDAWLQVQTPDGPRYTRDGRLNRSPDGALVSVDGHPVLDGDGNMIDVPEDVGPITVAADGTLSYTVEAAGEEVQTVELGRIGLFTLPNPEGLQREGSGLVAATGQPQPATDVTVVQGAVEGSNVQPIVEMVRLVDLTRAYGLASRLTETENDRQRNAINKLGGPAS
ncbi:flagellar basal-body rod protein FlgF [Oleisolibacter albus]|uniref:flagellar basal-body rod protein FlgF n=1 Tax=Oleisolibacter albus TaxID=2171757 RepID=UPI000DF2C213|nr:flagellar basal-body rod protein FlgF [Oleisolibacter albus]